MINETGITGAAPSAVTARTPLLSVRKIQMVCGDTILVLRGSSLGGAIVALLGASKSTTLKAIDCSRPKTAKSRAAKSSSTCSGRHPRTFTQANIGSGGESGFFLRKREYMLRKTCDM
jgi:hypothetical protein